MSESSLVVQNVSDSVYNRIGSGISPLEEQQIKQIPSLPPILKDLSCLSVSEEKMVTNQDGALCMSLQQLFPQTFGQPILNFSKVQTGEELESPPLKIGVVLSGGNAPGGHNVIAGIYDACKSLNPKSTVLGFIGGPSGITDNKYIRLTGELIDKYRNTGGFDIIGSGRTKIKTVQQFQATKRTMQAHDLDGLVVIGGDDSNTNAALLAEYFAQQNLKTACVGVPKTIDGDLANEHIEISFGFDTCCKVYANEIGNLARDGRSSAKYWFFVKMMGRSASHVTLEAAMQTRANLAIISEEVEAKQQSMDEIVQQMADVVMQRAELGKNYGIALIPEGLVEFIPEFKILIQDLNRLLTVELNKLVLNALKKPEQKAEYIESVLTTEKSRQLYEGLPIEIRIQLIMDRDPHGNVNVSIIETEKLFGEMVEHELERRRKNGTYKGTFNLRYHFCGYQGRSAFPSNFDNKYCYALGHVAVCLLGQKKNRVYQLRQEFSKTYQRVASMWNSSDWPNANRRTARSAPPSDYQISS